MAFIAPRSDPARRVRDPLRFVSMQRVSARSFGLPSGQSEPGTASFVAKECHPYCVSNCTIDNQVGEILKANPTEKMAREIVRKLRGSGFNRSQARPEFSLETIRKM